MATRLVQYYSELLGTKVSLSQALSYLNAQAAFIFTILPVEMSLIMRALGVLWLVSALLNCKKSGIKTSC